MIHTKESPINVSSMYNGTKTLGGHDFLITTVRSVSTYALLALYLFPADNGVSKS